MNMSVLEGWLLYSSIGINTVATESDFKVKLTLCNKFNMLYFIDIQMTNAE